MALIEEVLKSLGTSPEQIEEERRRIRVEITS
jgi:hypothetical protein